MSIKSALSVEEDRQARKGRNLKASLAVAALCLTLSALASVPFFFMAESPSGSGLWMPVTHDMILHFDQMKSFYQGISSGEIYPRWEEDTNRGFGAPSTSYYPPGVYYLTSLFYWFTGDWLVSLLVLHLLMMAASGAAIYIYSRRFLNRIAATAAMVAYIFLPYHIIDQYHRGAMAELLGFVWMPLMLLFCERLFKGIRATDVERESTGPKARAASRTLLEIAGLAAVYGAFLWSHPPTAYQFTLALGLFLLAMAFMFKEWRGLALAGLAIALGLGLAGAYLYPALTEQGLIRHEYISEVWPYHSTYVFAHALPYGHIHENFYKFIDFVWIFNALAIVIGAIVLLFIEPHYAAATRGLKGRVITWLIVGAAAAFMMTELSYPIGIFIPKIETGVFSWRMLAITTLMAALMAGACAQASYNAFKQKQEGRSNPYVSLITLIIIGGAVFLAAKLMPPLYMAPPFEPAPENVFVAVIPRTAPADPLELPRVDRAELAGGRGLAIVERWDPEHRSIKVEMNEPDRLLIRTFNFPGWAATINGEPATIQTGEALRVGTDGPEQELIRAATYRGETPSVDGLPGRIIGSEPLGDIIIDVPAGSHQVELRYTDTPARRSGGIITVTSFIVLIALALISLIGNGSKRGKETTD